MEKGFHLHRNYPADDHHIQDNRELLVFSKDRFYLICDLLQTGIAVKSENCQYKVNSNERLLYLVCRIKLSTFSQCRYTYYNLMEKQTKALSNYCNLNKLKHLHPFEDFQNNSFKSNANITIKKNFNQLG